MRVSHTGAILSHFRSKRRQTNLDRDKAQLLLGVFGGLLTCGPPSIRSSLAVWQSRVLPDGYMCPRTGDDQTTSWNALSRRHIDWNRSKDADSGKCSAPSTSSRSCTSPLLRVAPRGINGSMHWQNRPTSPDLPWWTQSCPR